VHIPHTREESTAGRTLRTDAEAVAAVAAVARRFVERGAAARSGSISNPVTPEQIAVGAAHRDQVAALRAALTNVPGMTVDPANRLQGREYEVTVILHPLSGRRDATAFHREAGRLYVHELLDAHPSTGPVHLHKPVKFRTAGPPIRPSWHVLRRIASP
jgi:hypothetical protein